MSSRFFSAQHIFYPVSLAHMWPNVMGEVVRFGHVGLVVISPRAKTVDFLDSLSKLTARPEVVGNMFRLLARHLGRDFIPSEWRMREGASAQQRGHEMVR